MDQSCSASLSVVPRLTTASSPQWTHVSVSPASARRRRSKHRSRGGRKTRVDSSSIVGRCLIRQQNWCWEVFELGVDVAAEATAALHSLSVVEVINPGIDIRRRMQVESLEENATEIIEDATEIATDAPLDSISGPCHSER